MVKSKQTVSNEPKATKVDFSEPKLYFRKLIKESHSTVPRGKPKSGRIWKSERKKFSSVIKTRGIKSSFEKKQELRQKLKQIKELSNAIKAEKEEEKEKKKERRRANLKRQEENRLKSEVVQVITNTKKLKKAKKKHLRNIEKRDTTVVSK
ncbi:coiled-coil domain-containing protein 86 isoform X1 [Diorhabda sublineata]|uniref:coiled-coil domain-containing protein 86 isoform X1 n=1 Tax=Diorhabda sublineata TaxID=1163346 RepID=UPI0024E15E19|nr:coiled-coil domain-containing protein 86 isoform X1 [Diorhabda sublineata]